MPHKTLKDFAHLEDLFKVVEFSEKFRFRNREQIRRLIRGFQIPEYVTCGTFRFTGEEVVLISLTLIL